MPGVSENVRVLTARVAALETNIQGRLDTIVSEVAGVKADVATEAKLRQKAENTREGSRQAIEGLGRWAKIAVGVIGAIGITGAGLMARLLQQFGDLAPIIAEMMP